jgi:aminoglycoside phosphotransferase (APT) family kinase protein
MTEDMAAWLARLRRRPPPAALAWAASAFGAGATVVGIRPLPGGISNGMHLVTIEHGGRSDEVVLRRFLSDWQDAGTAAREAAILDVLTEHGAPVPGVLAVDPVGDVCDAPALLITRVAGWRRLPAHPAPAWIESLADALLAIHTVPLAALPSLPDRVVEIATMLAGPPPESYERRPHDLPLRILAGRHVARVAARTDRTAALIHHDYWSGNTLRRGHRVVGVVDWSAVGVGDPGQDVGYCAMDLALCYGEDARDAFVGAYERLTSVPVAELPLWELLGALRPEDPAEWLSCWVELGLPVTVEQVRSRLAAVKARAAAALVERGWVETPARS